MALKIIKFWAKERGIYSSNFGYLNGITLTIMLAYVERILFSQTYPSNYVD
jgi:poly(A) polymerase Pap1